MEEEVITQKNRNIHTLVENRITGEVGSLQPGRRSSPEPYHACTPILYFRLSELWEVSVRCLSPPDLVMAAPADREVARLEKVAFFQLAKYLSVLLSECHIRFPRAWMGMLLSRHPLKGPLAAPWGPVVQRWARSFFVQGEPSLLSTPPQEAPFVVSLSLPLGEKWHLSSSLLLPGDQWRAHVHAHKWLGLISQSSQEWRAD